ncbi:hypothetical protein BDR26DRAFT_936787 [Obelidium mucronatum]|nr:hypothetical protein BDR26DRAFT_936787 [Obelidium mucronatum]
MTANQRDAPASILTHHNIKLTSSVKVQTHSIHSSSSESVSLSLSWPMVSLAALMSLPSPRGTRSLSDPLLSQSPMVICEAHRKLTDADNSEDDEIGDVDGGENELDAKEEEEKEEEEGEEKEEGEEEEEEVPVQQRKKVQTTVIEDDDDKIEVVEPVVHRKKRSVENIVEEEDEVEDDEDVLDDEEEVQAHPKKKQRAINLLSSNAEEEAEMKKMVSVKCDTAPDDHSR